MIQQLRFATQRVRCYIFFITKHNTIGYFSPWHTSVHGGAQMNFHSTTTQNYRAGVFLLQRVPEKLSAHCSSDTQNSIAPAAVQVPGTESE
jgi:hypothetical protein